MSNRRRSARHTAGPAPDSPILAAAMRELSAGGPYTAFLAPVAGPGGERLVRLTALDCALPDLDHLSAAVLLSSPGDLRGLTPLDLRLLGQLVAGTTQVPELAAATRRRRGWPPPHPARPCP